MANEQDEQNRKPREAIECPECGTGIRLTRREASEARRGRVEWGDELFKLQGTKQPKLQTKEVIDPGNFAAWLRQEHADMYDRWQAGPSGNGNGEGATQHD